MDKLKGLAIVLISLLCLAVCSAAFGFIHLERKSAAAQLATICYLDKPLWLKTDASIRLTISFREKASGWSEWKSLNEELEKKKPLNADYWSRDAKRYMVDALAQSYHTSGLDQERMRRTRGFFQVVRVLPFLTATEADSIQLKLLVRGASAQDAKTILLDPYAIPKDPADG